MEPAARQACASWRAAQEIPGWQGSASLLGGPEQPPGWPPHSGGRFCSSLASAWSLALPGRLFSRGLTGLIPTGPPPSPEPKWPGLLLLCFLLWKCHSGSLFLSWLDTD